jgi:hypothetical protein
MKLIKACRSAHLPKLGGSLQIGTYNYYRGIENPELQDVGEGTRSFSIKIVSGSRVPSNTLNHLMQGLISFGTGDPGPGLRAARLEMDSGGQPVEYCVNKDGTVTVNGSFTITAFYDNIFVFCMSLTEESDVPTFEGYDAHWTIPTSHADELAAGVAAALLKQANRETLNGFSPEIFPDGKAVVRYAHRPVQYSDRQVEFLVNGSSVSGNGKEFDHDGLLRKMDEAMAEAPFLKPLRYQKEREYRFIFEVGTRELTLPPKAERLILGINENNQKLLKFLCSEIVSSHRK